MSVLKVKENWLGKVKQRVARNSYHVCHKWGSLWLRLLSSFDVVLIFNDVLLRAHLNCKVNVRALDMKPHGPLKPPQVLVESVLVEWRTTVDTNPIPVHP
jgi:hypothetical protein